MQTLTIARSTKSMLLVLLFALAACFAFPSLAADAIPGAKEVADTGLATVRIVMIVIAVTIFIVSVLAIMAHKISFTQLIVISVCCVLLGAAEPIVRFLVNLGQSV